MTPEERKAARTWAHQSSPTSEYLRLALDALDERDALLRECLELIDGEWSGHEIQARISKVLGESDEAPPPR